MGTMKSRPKRSEYDAFSDLLGKLSRVPHDEVKAKLEAEKKAKRPRKIKKA